jgi:hypothetical protein
MRATLELRLREELLAKYLPEAQDIGRVLEGGLIRRVKIDSDEPLACRIRVVDQRLRHAGAGGLFYGWRIRRSYSRRELDAAELFRVRVTNVFEPPGEACGTMYDDSMAYEDCGAGAPQLTPLWLDGRRIPLNADFAQTIAGETIISKRAAQVFTQARLRGADTDPIMLANESGRSSQKYLQLGASSPRVELNAATRAGGSLFDESGYGRCAGGHVLGLNLLSEVSVERASLPDADIMMSRQMIGVRRGLLRPQPLLLLSPRALHAIEQGALHGLEVEIAHLA